MDQHVTIFLDKAKFLEKKVEDSVKDWDVLKTNKCKTFTEQLKDYELMISNSFLCHENLRERSIALDTKISLSYEEIRTINSYITFTSRNARLKEASKSNDFVDNEQNLLDATKNCELLLRDAEKIRHDAVTFGEMIDTNVKSMKVQKKQVHDMIEALKTEALLTNDNYNMTAAERFRELGFQTATNIFNQEVITNTTEGYIKSIDDKLKEIENILRAAQLLRNQTLAPAQQDEAPLNASLQAAGTLAAVAVPEH